MEGIQTRCNAALLVIGAAILSGCAAAGPEGEAGFSHTESVRPDEGPDDSSASSSAGPVDGQTVRGSPSPSPSMTTTSQPTADDAVATLERYWQILDGVRRDGQPIEEIYHYTGQQQRNHLFVRYKRDSHRAVITGEEVREVRSTEWLDDNTLEVEVCVDVSGVDVRHPETGAPLVADNRLDLQLLRYEMAYDPAAHEFGWVVMDEISQMIPCD